MNKIYIGADKSGFNLMVSVQNDLIGKGYEILNLGTQFIDNPIPFYSVAETVARAVQQDGKDAKGLLFCGTGMGMSQVANKFKGIRAACVESTYGARMSRAINDSNILCMGGWLIADVMGIKVVDEFLSTEFTQDLEDWRCDFLKKAKNEFQRIEDGIYRD